MYKKSVFVSGEYSSDKKWETRSVLLYLIHRLFGHRFGDFRSIGHHGGIGDAVSLCACGRHTTAFWVGGDSHRSAQDRGAAFFMSWDEADRSRQ